MNTLIKGRHTTAEQDARYKAIRAEADAAIALCDARKKARNEALIAEAETLEARARELRRQAAL